MFFSGHPLFSSPLFFSPYHPIPFPSLCSLHSPSPHPPHSSSAPRLPPPLPTPCVTGGALGRWEKLLVGSFFPPSVLTCSPAGQHILSTSVGLAGQTEPFCTPPNHSDLSCSSGSLTCGGTGVVGETGRHFQLNHTFQWFPPLCFSGALTANDLKEKKRLQV